MAVDGLSVAKLALYLALTPLAAFCLYKHHKSGISGWFYLNVFCVLRIVTGAIGVHGSTSGVTSVILNSIGLSPLMLACAGVIHQARQFCLPRLNKRTEMCISVQVHLVVAVGMVLMIVAVVNLENRNQVATMEDILHVGSAISALSWLMIVVWALWSAKTFHDHKKSVSGRLFKFGVIMVNGVCLAVPITGIRLGYGIAFLQLSITSPNSEFLTSTAVLVCLSLLTELIVVAVLIIIGIMTRTFTNEVTKSAAIAEGSTEEDLLGVQK